MDVLGRVGGSPEPSSVSRRRGCGRRDEQGGCLALPRAAATGGGRHSCSPGRKHEGHRSMAARAAFRRSSRGCRGRGGRLRAEPAPRVCHGPGPLCERCGGLRAARAGGLLCGCACQCLRAAKAPGGHPTRVHAQQPAVCRHTSHSYTPGPGMASCELLGGAAGVPCVWSAAHFRGGLRDAEPTSRAARGRGGVRCYQEPC
mmetsp:Transcript_13803/g.39096  ORF Transcript_13803/g.39096 Transcript_13803/m.39096 type:complete len:201 (+) Transcript_13803:314-916(+)